MAKQHVGLQSDPESRPARVTYWPWMDGMRAIAVLAVMVYHEMLTQPSLGIQHRLSGGELGVDVFFAISGFLITSLLLQEARSRGGIAFGAFYLRRARRLLPALFALLGVIVLVALFGEHGSHRTSTLEHVALTIAYAGNWVQGWTAHGMHELGQTWSLAIEEQFYLVWPAIITGLLILNRRRLKGVVAGVFAITVLSVVWLEFAIHQGWVSGSGAGGSRVYNRIYFSLDTRAASLAFGALLGAIYISGLIPRTPLARVVRRVLAVGGLLVLIVLFHNVGQFGTFLVHHHQGRFARYADFSIYALTSLATTCVIWELVETAPHLGHRILSWPPLVAVGRISYGLYLWDGTLTVWLTKDSIGVDRWPLLVIRTVLTFVAATASWFLVERHFRQRRPGPAPDASPVPGG